MLHYPFYCEREESLETRQVNLTNHCITLVECLKYKKVFDVGCGNGYFTLPALDVVGAAGKVIGLDTSEEMLERLKIRAASVRNGHLELKKSGEYSFPLEEKTGTFALLSFVFHEVDDPGRFVRETMRVLKKGATLL